MCYTVEGVRKPMKERLRGTKQLPVKHPLRGFIAESVTRSGVESKGLQNRDLSEITVSSPQEPH